VSDHIPQATTTTWDSPVLVCSCGWDSEEAREPWPDHLPDSLDAAWAEAEEALPGYGGVSVRRREDEWVERSGEEYVAALWSDGRAWDECFGPTPAAALRALAAKLREAQG